MVKAGAFRARPRHLGLNYGAKPESGAEESTRERQRGAGRRGLNTARGYPVRRFVVDATSRRRPGMWYDASRRAPSPLDPLDPEQPSGPGAGARVDRRLLDQT